MSKKIDNIVYIIECDYFIFDDARSIERIRKSSHKKVIRGESSIGSSIDMYGDISITESSLMKLENVSMRVLSRISKQGHFLTVTRLHTRSKIYFMIDESIPNSPTYEQLYNIVVPIIRDQKISKIIS